VISVRLAPIPPKKVMDERRLRSRQGTAYPKSNFIDTDPARSSPIDAMGNRFDLAQTGSLEERGAALKHPYLRSRHRSIQKEEG
jgi:hypothetical protein